MILGKDTRKGIVSIAVDKKVASLYYNDGKREEIPLDLFILWTRKLSPKHIKLNGNADFGYATKYDDLDRYKEVLKSAKNNKHEIMTPWNNTENLMIKGGYNNFLGIKVSDISVLSFDIETTGLDPNHPQARVLLISNTFRSSDGTITKRLFAYDDYIDNDDMLVDWCAWVRELDPAFLMGHNIFSFDLPYMNAQTKSGLKLGREGQRAVFSKYPREFRKDGSQSYSYKNVNIHGREIIDTFFLTIKYDIGRKYPSYRLKEIINFEGLEKKDRQFYDASQIFKRYRDKDEWAKIKKYAEDDADDALALYDLMIPSFFYYAQYIPKKFQEIINGASGAQINALMVRSYIAKACGVPRASAAVSFEGAISFGKPGIYKNVFKVDVASLYPSIMLSYEVYDVKKDPDAHLLKVLQLFTTERLKNKQKAKETKDPYFDALQSSQKILINSVYGFMGAVGLNFNSPENAANVTRIGRDILTKSINWAESKGYEVVNGDTDSIAYCGSTQTIQEDLKELNALYPKMIHWEDDGVFDAFMIVKKKNYIMKQGDKLTIKGSGLKATMKEKALRDFIKQFIDCLMNSGDYKQLYMTYAKRIKYLRNIDEWCSKKTVTKSVLNPKRTTERRILDAIEESNLNVSEGDKIQVFFETNEKLSVLQQFKGVYSKEKLYGKLYDTAKIFSTVFDKEEIPKLTLKKYKELEERI